MTIGLSAGDWAESLPTPALVLDHDAMIRNLDRMAAHYRGPNAAVRPHTKTHKSPCIAALQLARGAAGICVAKLSEAETMIEAGIEDVLVTSGVVDPARIRRAAALARRTPRLRMVSDHVSNLEAIGEAAAAAGVTLGVLVDLDCGAHRSGAAMGRQAVALAEQAARHPALRFDGFQAFASDVMHLDDYQIRRRAELAVLDQVIETRRLAERAGLDVEIVSVGGTGTWDIDCEVDGVTEVQVGSYLFMDVMYRAIGGARGPVFDHFEPALFVLATAISQPVGGQLTIDAGYKASATDHQPPEPWGVGQVTYRFAGDEHGILTLTRPSRHLGIGSRVLLLPGHCDPTVNLYDHYAVVSDGRLIDTWPVAGRGQSQ